jgi:hypothetical protein
MLKVLAYESGLSNAMPRALHETARIKSIAHDLFE